MNSVDANDMPDEIDFSKGVRGLHHIPRRQGADAGFHRERGVGVLLREAQQRGVDLSDLVTEVLKRDIEINEALK